MAPDSDIELPHTSGNVHYDELTLRKTGMWGRKPLAGPRSSMSHFYAGASSDRPLSFGHEELNGNKALGRDVSRGRRDHGCAGSQGAYSGALVPCVG